MDGGGAINIQAQIDYREGRGNLASVRIDVSDGSSISIPVPANIPTSGTLLADLDGCLP